MRILTVVSGLDFINFTRRATIEAIHKAHPDHEILLFNSVLNLRKKKTTTSGIRFHSYHFWVPERLRKVPGLKKLEYILRRFRWKRFFRRFDVIFFIDPNQYYLLPYLSKDHKLVYLLRDPSILMDPRNHDKELPVIKRANAILPVSENLCHYYFEKYYGFIPRNVHLWSNTVDLNLWNYDRWKTGNRKKTRPVVGLAGNINYVIDLDLLRNVAMSLPEYDFELAGKMELREDEKIPMEKLLDVPNVRYLGFIPYNDFPAVVINWNVGLVAAKQNDEFARYLNNNKQYQYMALGKPFVTFRMNAGYGEFGDMVFIASDPDDYIRKIRLAVEKSEQSDTVSKGISVALRQSAEVRAEQFIKIVKQL
jgi:glycosyltransferase involved in cell wall biosynthesis